MSVVKIKVDPFISILVIVSVLLLDIFSYSPYGNYPHYLAVFSSSIIFYLFYRLVIFRELRVAYIFPFLTLNWIYFLSPFLLEDKTEYFLRIIKDKYIDEIALYCSLSILLIALGYLIFFNTSVKPITSKKFKFNELGLKRLIWFFVVTGVLYRIGERVSPSLVIQLSNLIQLLFYAPTIVFSLYVLYQLRYSKFRFDTLNIVVIGFLILEFILRLSTTLFAQIIILFVGALLTYFREKKSVPIVSIIISIMVLYPLYESRKYFRLVEFEDNTSVNEYAIGTGIIKKMIQQDDLDTKIESFQSKMFHKEHNRFENLSFISHVVLQHKTGIKPFLNGETFYWLPLVPIPRIIFPSKPQNLMSSKVATEYGLRGKTSTSSINFPMLVEAYINFDFNGMLIMALLFGLSFKFFVMKFGEGIGDINLIIILNSIKQFTHAEGNITLVFGAFIQVWLFWWVLNRFYDFNKLNT